MAICLYELHVGISMPKQGNRFGCSNSPDKRSIALEGEREVQFRVLTGS